MRNTYDNMIKEEKAKDGVQDRQRVYVLFDEQELNYLRSAAAVSNLPLTTVLRIIVREHKQIVEVVG